VRHHHVFQEWAIPVDDHIALQEPAQPFLDATVREFPLEYFVFAEEEEDHAECDAH